MKRKAPPQDVNVVNPNGKPIPVEVRNPVNSNDGTRKAVQAEIVNDEKNPGNVKIINGTDPVVVTGALVGDVTVSNQPTVTAVQSGTWKVEVQNPNPSPAAPTLPPDFAVDKIVEWWNPAWMGSTAGRQGVIKRIHGEWVQVNITTAHNDLEKGLHWMKFDGLATKVSRRRRRKRRG